MPEEASAIDVYYDMDIAQICQHFNKSRNTVDKAIAKLVKDNPDKDWKYKNPATRRITIKAEGVERLSTYFRKEKHELSTVEMELRFENEKLKAIIEEKEKAQAQIEQLYQEKLKLEGKITKKEELKMIIFDVLPKDEFDNKASKETYKTRKQHLLDLKQYKTENIDIVEMFYEGTDQSEIWKWLDYAEEHDMEGLMLSLNAPYECKRTKNLIKIKKFFDLDLQIVDYEEGTGRNKGKLGAFVVDFKGNKVKVGSGFSDSERDKFWNDRDDLVGRVITVKYKEISKDKKTGLESLQFPVFCGLREIGKEVSYE